jgi:hypothetical protein
MKVFRIVNRKGVSYVGRQEGFDSSKKPRVFTDIKEAKAWIQIMPLRQSREGAKIQEGEIVWKESA